MTLTEYCPSMMKDFSLSKFGDWLIEQKCVELIVEADDFESLRFRLETPHNPRFTADGYHCLRFAFGIRGDYGTVIIKTPAVPLIRTRIIDLTEPTTGSP